MARHSRRGPAPIDVPRGTRVRGGGGRSDRFGRFTEAIARGMGTPWFIFGLTIFVIAWMGYTHLAESNGWWRFDSVVYGFTVLTLVLSLQASYAAPLILLAQNRQDDRDRVAMEQDRQRAERNLQDTEYLAREIVALRLAVEDLASRDFVKQELRALLAELEREEQDPDEEPARP